MKTFGASSNNPGVVLFRIKKFFFLLNYVPNKIKSNQKIKSKRISQIIKTNGFIGFFLRTGILGVNFAY